MRNPKRVALMAAVWVAATAATAGIALAVVGLAGEQVTDSPVRPLRAAEVEALGMPAATSSTAAPGPETTTAPAPGTTSTTDPPPATTLADTTTVPTTPTTAAAPPSTAAATTTTTTTAVPSEEPSIDSRRITGGKVVVRWTSSWVEFVSATPDDGYDVDVEDRGPEKVEVEFEGHETHSRYRARIENGELVVETGVEVEEG